MKFYDILGQEITDLDNVFVHLHRINGNIKGSFRNI